MSGRNPIPREQSYEGVRAVNPPEMITAKRSPTIADTKYTLGTLWLNTVTQLAYIMVGNPGIWTQFN